MTVSNVFTLDVDIKEASYAYDRKITAKDNVTFIINLTNEGLPLDLSGVTTVSLANTRLDQVTVVTPGVKTGSNQVTFNLGQNETKNPGRVSAVVQLYDTNGRVSMLGFNYTVITDPTGELYIPQGDELTLIQVVLGDGPLVIEQARQATTNADSATADARTAIQNVTATINALNDNMDVAISNMNTNVNNNIATVNNDMKITHKGTVATYANLPTSNRQVGDTYVVTSDTTATNNGIWRWQSNSTWLKINNLNISGAETVSNVGVVAKAAADIARQTIMSGVLDYDSKVVDVRSMTIPKGGIGSNPTDASGNRLFLGASNASLNGYKVLLEGVNADKSNTITLPDPPTFGTRDDLVFLEAWFPSTGNGYELSWRIRTVVGVDFGKYVSDGITDSKGYGTTLGDPIVTPQGGNISSMSYDSTSSITRTITAFRRANVSDSILKFSDDVGLYIAGDGSQTSKDSLKTLDGYVYAIPLFRVKRRNSGGYRIDNQFGARDYFVTTTGSNAPTNTSTIVNDVSGFKVGYKIQIGSSFNASRIGTITSIDTVTKTLNYIGIDATNIFSGTSWTVYVVSDRHDSLYSNIISSDDIIDLRHKVSLTGFNPEQLANETFDKLQRGELTTKDTKTTTKETFNLRKAPLGLQQELQSVERKRPDGTSVQLKNLLGIQNVKNNLTNLGVGYNVYASANGGIDQLIGKMVSITSGKYYLFITYWDANTTNNINMLRAYNGSTIAANTQLGGTPTNSGSMTYVKFVAPSTDTISLAWRNNVASSNYYHKNSMLIELAQSEYNLIDVDPNWTGSDKISNLYPYVDSPVNFVENLLPPSTDSNWTLHANAKVISDSSILLTATGNNQTSTVVIPVLPNQTYVLSSNISTNAVIEVYEGGNWRFTLNSWETSKLFTTTSAATSIQLSLHNYTAGAGTFYFSNLKLERGSTANPFVPYGRWYLPYDYATGQTKTYITESFNSQRQTFSDALTSETITDKIEVLKTPQRHVKVTQATEGTWVVGDTIKVNSDYGVISGVGAVVGVISESYTTAGGNVTSVTLKFTDASKFTVGDTFMRFTTNGVFVNPTTVYTVTSVDAVSVTFTTNANVASFAYYSGDLFIETTSPSSDPTVTATGIAGTWSGLGTKTATYTITTAPTDNKCDILIQYAVNYPAGKGLVNLPTDVLSAEVNGQKLVSGQTVQIKANFDGKTANNTDLIPHKIKKVSFSDITTVNPSTSGTELTQSEYNSVFALDGSTTSNSTATSGEKVGYIIPFDLIRLLEDKLGEQVFADCANTASKVAKLKGTAPFASPMIDKIQCDWWGYGSSPSGNKASFKLWNAINSNWVGSLYHTNASVTKLTGSTAANYQHEYIDSNGFVHFLAFAEPAGTDANGNVVASTINTDYCELSVSLKLPSGTVLTPENQMPVLSDNLLTSNQAFPVDLSGFTQINTTLSIDSLGVLKIPAISTNAGNYYGFSIDAISIGNKTGYHTFSCRFKGQNGIGYRVFFYDGSTRTDIVSFVGTGDWQTIKGSASRLNINQGLRIDGVGSVGADLTFYVSNLKVEQGNNPNPVWTAGRNKKKTLNFLGKLAGSVTENPHVAKYARSTVFLTPSSFTNELKSSDYVNSSKQDGVLFAYNSSIVGEYAQQLFEFDLSHLGLSLSELKKVLRKLTVSWTGYGSGDNAGVLTYGATVKMWQSGSTNAWASFSGGTYNNTESSPTTLSAYRTNSIDQFVTNSQKIYILVHSTYPASATNPSSIFTDYVKLDVEMSDQIDFVKSNIVTVIPETKEIKLMFPAVSYRTGLIDQVSLHYRYIPKQGEQLGVVDKELTKPFMYYLSTVGTGAYSTENRSLLWQLLGATSDYLGQSLHSFVSKGIKQLPFEVDMMASKPIISGNFVVMASKVVVKGGQLYLRVFYKESKNLGTYVDLSNASYVDFAVNGRCLIKGV